MSVEYKGLRRWDIKKRCATAVLIPQTLLGDCRTPYINLYERRKHNEQTAID